MNRSRADVDTLSVSAAKRESTILKALPKDLEDLVKRSRRDPGVPYATIERLERLRTEDPSAWIRVRTLLKSVPDVSIGALEDLMNRKSRASDVNVHGQALEWTVTEPWPEPVDGAALLTAIADFIQTYVFLAHPLADAIVLWIVMTWIHDRLSISTFLNVTSATKRCGKSLLLEVLGELVHRPLSVGGSVTSAALFRTIERYAPTMLLDEADTYFSDAPELRGIVNSSQRRDSASVLRCVGDEHEPRRFGTWCPKAIAGIGGLPDTVLDRALVVHLERRPHQVKLARWRDRDRGAIEDLRRCLSRWTNDEEDNILRGLSAVTFPPGLHDRARDAWESPLAIGTAAGGEWSGPDGRVWAACLHVTASSAGDADSARELLLADLRTIFEARHWPEALTSAEILDQLGEMENRPWCEWRNGQPLTARGLSNLLKPFGVQPRQRKHTGENRRSYVLDDLHPLWASYLPEAPPIPSATPLPAPKNNVLAHGLSATGDGAAADRYSGTPLKNLGGGSVADRNPPSADEQENLDHAVNRDPQRCSD